MSARAHASVSVSVSVSVCVFVSVCVSVCVCVSCRLNSSTTRSKQARGKLKEKDALIKDLRDQVEKKEAELQAKAMEARDKAVQIAKLQRDDKAPAHTTPNHPSKREQDGASSPRAQRVAAREKEELVARQREVSELKKELSAARAASEREVADLKVEVGEKDYELTSAQEEIRELRQQVDDAQVLALRARVLFLPSSPMPSTLNCACRSTTHTGYSCYVFVQINWSWAVFARACALPLPSPCTLPLPLLLTRAPPPHLCSGAFADSLSRARALSPSLPLSLRAHHPLPPSHPSLSFSSPSLDLLALTMRINCRHNSPRKSSYSKRARRPTPQHPPSKTYPHPWRTSPISGAGSARQ